MEIFKASIEEDTLYRKSELTLLKKNCYMSSITDNRLNIIIKYTPVAIYSIFEGYFVNTMEFFIDYINRQNYERKKLKDSILSKELEVKYDAFTIRNNKRKRIEHLNNLETFYSNENLILSKELNTKSNVNLKIVNDVFEVYGVQSINNKDIEGKLNKLLKFRNSIAHGEYSIKVTLSDINEFVQCIDIAIDLIYDNILIAFNEKCYLK